MARWTPTSEDDLRRAASDGLLDESAVRTEFKREIGSSKTARKRFAQELASLALDGGQLIVGIADEKDRSGEESALVPFPLEGEIERIEAIAGSIPDPPVSLFCTPIRSDGDDDMGYILVEIPASAAGPHMVDGTYYGRSGTSKRPLTDPEVVRLHDLRQRRAEAAQRELEGFFERGATLLKDAPTTGRLYIVASPIVPKASMALRWWEPHGEQAVQELFQPARGPGAIGPLAKLHFQSRTIDGLMASSSPIENPEDWARTGELQIVEISEDGVLRGMHGRVVSHQEGRDPQLLPQTVLLFTRRILEAAAILSETLHYTGLWSIAVRVSGLAGSTAYLGEPSFRQPLRYPGDAASGNTTAGLSDLRLKPGYVTDQLLGQMLRAAGIAKNPAVREFLTDDHVGA